MTFGLEVRRASGQVVVNRTMPGGRLFLERIVRSPETPGLQTTYTYPLVPGGSNLRILQVGGSTHTYATGTNGSGHATLTLTSIPRWSSGSFPWDAVTTLLVFSTATIEPDFGVLTTNDAGERTISSVFPSAEYIGRRTFSSWGATVTNSFVGQSSLEFRSGNYTGPTFGTRLGFVMWALPEVSGDYWYDENGGVVAPVGTVTGNIPGPTGFLFAIDGFNPSAETFGIRTYNSSGQLMFDGGLGQMILSGYGVSDIASTATVVASTQSLFSGITPAVLLPSVSTQAVANIGGGQCRITFRRIHYRRPSTTGFESRMYIRNQFIDDVAPGTLQYFYGQFAGVQLPIIDAANHP